MAEPLAIPDRTMSREEFLAWVAQQPRGRFERIGGQVVAMSPERFGHVRAKTAVWAALRDAIVAAGADCEAVGDGVTVSVDADTDYEPDVLVNCGEPAGDEAIVAPNPVVVVVEVISPSSKAVDTGAKFMDYFRVASIRHYLILRTDQRMVVHHRRRDDGAIESRLLGQGPVALDPPGIVLKAESFFAR